VFAASLNEVAIASGVSRVTAIKYRNQLITDGWLHYGHQAGKGHLASTYFLSVPKADICGLLPTGLRGSTRMSAFGAGSSGRDPQGEGASAKQNAREKSPLVDISSDSDRYRATNTLWEVMPYVTEATTVRELAGKTGKSERQVRRKTQQLFDMVLIADRRHIKLVDDWRDRWESLAETMGTAGKRAAAEKQLAQQRLARKRMRLLQEDNWVAGDGFVVNTQTGEIV
jgi:hypothetical protein